MHQKKDGRWYAQIKINGIQKFLGCFETPEEASKVYEETSLEVYGEFKRK